MHVGIIGGGLMGTALAWHLAEAGVRVTLLEQGTELGGLSGELRFDETLAVPRYQHAILPTDTATRALCARLGLADELIFRDVLVGFVHENQIHPMTTIIDFLSFAPLSFRSRLQLGQTIVRARRRREWQTLDRMTAKEWLLRVGSVETFERIWRPLLEMKFDGAHERVPATYIWAWLNRMAGIRRFPQMRARVGYLRHGHYALVRALAEATIRHGGEIVFEARVREIAVRDGLHVRTQHGALTFDKVVAAVATPVFARLLPGADEGYLDLLAQDKYLGLICPVMVLDRPLSRYWTLNITDTNSPFSTIVETPHPQVEGLYVVYLPRYTAPDHDWMGVPDSDIQKAWFQHLRRIFPVFDERAIRHFAVSRTRYVEPVYAVDVLDKSAPAQTRYPGLYLANTGQVYPELPTSESVIRHAQRLAEVVRHDPVAVHA